MPVFFVIGALDGPDVVRLRPLISLDYFEFHWLALLEGFVALHLDGGVVDEYIGRTTLNGDKAIALFRVEPLDRALCHVLSQRNGWAENAPCEPRATSPECLGTRTTFRGFVTCTYLRKLRPNRKVHNQAGAVKTNVC